MNLNKRILFFLSIAILALLLTACGSSTSSSMANLPKTQTFEFMMVANQPQGITLEDFDCAEIMVPDGTKFEIINMVNVTKSPSGWAISRSGSKPGQFEIKITDCPDDCPVKVTVTVSK